MSKNLEIIPQKEDLINSQNEKHSIFMKLILIFIQSIVFSVFYDIKGTMSKEGEMEIDFLESNSALDAMEQSIKTAEEGQTVVIKMQTWRADEVGNQMAKACLQALENGAKVIIFKDDMGIPFELGDSTGYSFFPETPTKNVRKILSRQTQKMAAEAMRNFYEKPRPNDCFLEESRDLWLKLESFIKTGQCQVTKEKRYDHSKLILKVDENGEPLQAFVGGVVLGQEFKEDSPEGYTPDNWADGMLNIQDEKILELLKNSLCANDKVASDTSLGIKVLSNSSTKEGESYSDAVTQTMKKYHEEILMTCPYLGDIEIIEALEKAGNVEVVIPEVSNWSKDRTRHFLWELSRRINKGFKGGLNGASENNEIISYWMDFILESQKEVPPNIGVKFARRMIHLKAMVLNKTCAVIGSGNFSETHDGSPEGQSCFQELGMILDANENPALLPLVEKIKNYIESLVTPESRYPAKRFYRNWFTRESDGSQGKREVHFSLLFSQLERFVLAFQKFMMNRVRPKKLGKQRLQEQEIFQEIFREME